MIGRDKIPRRRRPSFLNHAVFTGSEPSTEQTRGLIAYGWFRCENNWIHVYGNVYSKREAPNG